LPQPCPECGAALEANASCQAIFDAFLILEFEDPAYGEVHILTVACFMIQHRRYSDEALVWIEQTLRTYLDENTTVAQIRKHAAHETSQSARTWKVTRQPNARPLPKIAWSMTIADVASTYQDAASYCAAVKEWARCTLQQMRPLLPA
jgi:hypothetical protein